MDPRPRCWQWRSPAQGQCFLGRLSWMSQDNSSIRWLEAPKQRSRSMGFAEQTGKSRALWKAQQRSGLQSVWYWQVLPASPFVAFWVHWPQTHNCSPQHSSSLVQGTSIGLQGRHLELCVSSRQYLPFPQSSLVMHPWSILFPRSLDWTVVVAMSFVSWTSEAWTDSFTLSVGLTPALSLFLSVLCCFSSGSCSTSTNMRSRSVCPWAELSSRMWLIPESTISGRMPLQTAVRAKTSKETRNIVMLLLLLLPLLHYEEGVAVNDAEKPKQRHTHTRTHTHHSWCAFVTAGSSPHTCQSL